MSSTPPAALGHLNAALMRLQDIQYSIDQIRAHLSNAYQAAVEKQQSTVQIRFLQSEFDSLDEIIVGQVRDLLQKAAEVEARSEG